MNAVVTGAAGLIGGYLVEHLRVRDHAVTAVDIAGACEKLDMLDRAGLVEMLREKRPDAIFHLAAQSLPNASWDDPSRTFEINVVGTVNLLEAVRAEGLAPVIVIACSSGEYAVSKDGRPISEDGAMGPSTPYAVSKLAVDHLARLYHERHGLRTIRVRPFFLVGPRKRGDVCSDFARGIVACERGGGDTVAVGNMDVVRDMLDVRDGAAAMALAAEKGRPGEVYNICSGRGVRIADVFEALRKMAKVPVRAARDPARMRPIEEMVKIGDASKLNALGWKALYTLKQTLSDILEYWRGAE